MDNRRITLIGITLVLTVWMAACAAAAQDQSPAQSSALPGTEWVLVSLNGNALIEGKEITLRFGEGSLEGSGGCNTYGGSYAVSGDSLSINGVYATEMACMKPEGIMEQEKAYFDTLNTVVRYLVDNDQMELYDEAGAQILSFISAGGSGSVQVAPTTEPFGQSAALADSEWMLIALNGQPPIEGKQITLRFGDTSIEGSGGCSWYWASYTASGNSLSLNEVCADLVACIEPQGIMEQERAYLDALNAVARYQVAQDQGGDRLELYSEDGKQVLAFVALTSTGEVPANTTDEFSLDCTLEMDETYPVGEPVNLRFALHNQTDRPLYVLTWYTPLEGIAGEIFQVTRDGEELPYQGMLAKRGDPTREEYITIEPGEVAPAEVDLRMGYDLSTPGSYQVQFTAGLQDVSDDAALVPLKRDDHRPQSLSCNTVSFRIVPMPEPPTATPTPEPPAGFKQYQDSVAGVSVWVPESWFVTGIIPGEFAILQSYPEDKYAGGGGQRPGNTKCDLTIRPPDIDMASHMQQLRSNPAITVISEQEITLQSGKPGIRVEANSMGPSLSLITEVNERVVVLICFGELAPFDEIAVTLGSSE